MSIRVSNVRLSVDESEAALPAHLARLLGLRADEVQHWRILRKSLDARRKDALQFVYSAELTLPVDSARIVQLSRRGRKHQATVELFAEPPFTMPVTGT